MIVDDYSRFTWVLFLTCKDEAFDTFKTFAKKVQNKKESDIISICMDHGGEFENQLFKSFCDMHGIEHNFSAPYTPQQNNIVE